MSNNTYIVVFPSLFAENKISLLIANIKKILKIQNQNFSKISRDGNLILVDANDPVFASSAIGLLFGIKEILIAKQIKNDFKSVVDEITKTGSSLLLKGEKFYVSVEGIPKGYMTKDVELSATSSLIEKNKSISAKPGTKEKHDKLLFTHITKANAYVSIFSDKGLGGTVNNSQEEKIVCGVFDEFSIIACLETIKQGFEVKVVVFYKNRLELMNIVKMLHKILPRTLETKSQVEFYKADLGKNFNVKNLALIKILTKIAVKEKISFVSLPVSPLIFSSEIIKKLKTHVFELGLVPIIPLSGIDSGIFDNAKEIGLEKHIPKIEKFIRTKIQTISDARILDKDLRKLMRDRKIVSVNHGPNMIHDILDSLELKH